MQHLKEMRDIMIDFAASTGLSDLSREPRRYLWTDAFAVCNFIELARQTGEASFLLTARQLVEQVHFVLGRYSVDDARKGWISGLGEPLCYEHPTIGGLRIGKKKPERKPDEPFNERLEWDRDGQYFHYLTRWMQALTRIAAFTGEERYQCQALELARASHSRFTYQLAANKPKRMYWKMSVDLSRPQVTSMGHHDPLDALITYLELQTNNTRFDKAFCEINLANEIAESHAMCVSKSWATHDPLGTGGLLVDTWRFARIYTRFDISVGMNLTDMLRDCEAGLEAFQQSGTVHYPAEQRLAFREFGLSIGLHALDRLNDLMEQNNQRFSMTERRQVASLRKFSGISEVIENFWLQPVNRKAASWRDHADINSVMLATSLAPDAYLSVFCEK